MNSLHCNMLSFGDQKKAESYDTRRAMALAMPRALPHRIVRVLGQLQGEIVSSRSTIPRTTAALQALQTAEAAEFPRPSSGRVSRATM